jgi:hypothetical protein
MPSLLNENCVQLALEQESCLPHRKRALRQNGAYRMPPRRSPFPFLWNFLVDNLLRTVFLFPVLFAAYADDTNVATSHKDPAIATQNLQLACNVVEAWLNSRKLILNAIITSFSFSHASSLLSPTFFSLLMESKSSPRWKYHSSDFCWTPN